MEQIKYTFRNKGLGVYNDDVYEVQTFKLLNTEYSFKVSPSQKTRFWRFGIALSQTEQFEFKPNLGRYENSALKFIEIDVGDKPTDDSQINNHILIGSYHIDPYEGHPKRKVGYKEYSTVEVTLKFDLSQNIYFSYTSADINDSQVFPVKDYNYFRIFAWADEKEFLIDCVIDINETGNSKTNNDLLNQAVSSSRFDELINTLVDGNEEQRADLLRVIQTNKVIDRNAFSMRLRSEIETRFNPKNERAFASAIRDPKKISSIRSWMLSSLIWVDAEDISNRELVLNHITNNEPDENVRYWALAGLFQKKVSYLDKAVETGLKSDISVVSLLAEAITYPSDSSLIEKFRKILFSDTFEEAWKVLRILRVVPIPAIASDVCLLLDKKLNNLPLAYDAFYALTNPEMINAAVDILTENIGVKGVVERIISTVRGANVNTIRNFVHMLLPFDRREVDSILSESHRNPQTRDIAGRIIDYLDDYRQQGTVKGIYIAGFDADSINVNYDWLNIQEDVKTLTAVMLAKEVKPPLAIGLFGDWGTGKTFFMKSMQAEIGRMRKKDKDSDTRFCSHTVQIEFNAWHYVDTNLWASLISSIFEKLAAYVCPKATAEEEQATFISELGSTKIVASEAQVEKELAEKQIAEKQKLLQELQLKREQKKVSLKDLQVEDISKLLDPAENEQLKKTLNDIGIPAVLNSISDVNNIVSEVYTIKGRIAALFFSIINSKNRWILIGLLTFFLIIIPLLVWLAHKYLDVNKILATITLIISESVALISALVFVARKALQKVSSAIDVVEASKKRIDTLLAEKRKTPSAAETALQAEIIELNVKEKEAVAKLTVATNRLIEIEERIRSLKEEQSLNRFLTDRTSSEDYRKHLGLISIIRQDLESLTKKLGAKQDQDSKFKPVDRIILYIDDLDRCPSGKVMEVLQAVHLLLAFPLFVVVVGVDPRWLLHSLASEHSVFNNSGISKSNDPNSWRTTPQNFLEKIFQIPFCLRSMTNKGFGSLIQSLLTPLTPETNRLVEATTEDEPTVQINKNSRTEKKSSSLLRSGTSTLNEATGTEANEQNADAREMSDVEHKTSTTGRFKINEESLVIKYWETNFAGDLLKMIPTPRSAKRFANVYRILKASVPNERLVTFEGSAELPGDFQVPMLLLGVLTGAPEEAVKLFPALIKQSNSQKGIKELFKNIEIEEKEKTLNFNTIIENMLPIINANWFPDDPELLTEWIPRVSRFSFDLGRTIQE